jgi:hypothetical protein
LSISATRKPGIITARAERAAPPRADFRVEVVGNTRPRDN